jgi:hypothetical protein
MNGESLAEQVLEQLLDRYEASKAFVSGARTQRRVQVRMSDQVVPGYISGGLDPDALRRLHADLERWQAEGIISLKWVKHEKGNLLERVYLEWDGIARAYAVLGRRPLADELGDLLAELDAWRPCLDAPWLQRWLNDIRAQVVERGRIPTSLVPADADRRRQLFAAFAGLLDKGEEELTLRLFSKRYLRSSKAFERQVQERFLAVVRRYWLPTQGESGDRGSIGAGEVYADDARLLAELGIQTSHDDVAFAGPLEVRLDGGVIDCGRFPLGLALDPESVRRLEVVRAHFARILTIENKANYRHYVRRERAADELVVYLGGFASPAARRFLATLRRYFLDAGRPLPAFYHWGDLDYGGVLILQHLREAVWPEVEPWRMDASHFDELAAYVEPADPAYLFRVAALLEDPRYGWARPLLQRILDVRGTLEQEAFLV